MKKNLEYFSKYFNNFLEKKVLKVDFFCLLQKSLFTGQVFQLLKPFLLFGTSTSLKTFQDYFFDTVDNFSRNQRNLFQFSGMIEIISNKCLNFGSTTLPLDLGEKKFAKNMTYTKQPSENQKSKNRISRCSAVRGTRSESRKTKFRPQLKTSRHQNYQS